MRGKRVNNSRRSCVTSCKQVVTSLHDALYFLYKLQTVPTDQAPLLKSELTSFSTQIAYEISRVSLIKVPSKDRQTKWIL